MRVLKANEHYVAPQLEDNLINEDRLIRSILDVTFRNNSLPQIKPLLTDPEFAHRISEVDHQIGSDLIVRAQQGNKPSEASRDSARQIRW